MNMTTQTIYGYCPQCGAIGLSRERRPNGNDKCANGHTYPSGKALSQPNEPVRWAEDLILQLPLNHDGRNSWLLNHGNKTQAKWIQNNREKLILLSGKEHTDFLTKSLQSIDENLYSAPPNLEAKIVKLTTQVNILEELQDEYLNERAELTAKCEKMREALEFYADDARWFSNVPMPENGDKYCPNGNDFPYLWTIDRDNGDIAKQVLEEYK